MDYAEKIATEVKLPMDVWVKVARGERDAVAQYGAACARAGYNLAYGLPK